jgi:hypothetical protein
VNHFSLVFSEARQAETRAEATVVLHSPPKAQPHIVFDQHLLAAWLNFANGSVGLDTPVDTNRDGVPDTTFGEAMLAAETVRVDPASTPSQIRAQKDVVERISTQSE